MAEIEKCPFCGAGASIITNRDDDCCIRCIRWGKACMAAGPWANTEAEAIAAWNRRTPPPQAAGGEPVAWMVGNENYPSEAEAVEAIRQWGPSDAIAKAVYDHPPAVGQEWVVVQRLPTSKMILDGVEGYARISGEDAKAKLFAAWHAMVAAAPAQPASYLGMQIVEDPSLKPGEIRIVQPAGGRECNRNCDCVGACKAGVE